MIVVHHLDNSRSQRILWLLEELGVQYEIRFYKRNRLTMLAPAELRKIHPLGKSPVITDGGSTVAESGAIIEYLITKYGGGALKPASGTADFLKYTYWLHYAEGSLMSPILLTFIFNRIMDQAVPFFIKPVTKGLAKTVLATYVKPELQKHLAFVEDELKGKTWFAGPQISGADIQMSFPLETAITLIDDNVKRPNINEFLLRIQSREPYKRALQKGNANKS